MYQNIKVLVFGMARSGYEVAKLLSHYNNEIIVTDAVKQDPEHVAELEDLNVRVEITDDPSKLLDDTFNLVVKNPGIKYSHPLLNLARELNIPIVNELEVAYQFMNHDAQIIGVTGSNGKTTTINLVYNFLIQEKDDVILGGNIGTPLSHYINDIKPSTILALEISDHQLCDMYKFKTNVSVITNITPTHLDFHDSYDRYKAIKHRIFNNHTAEDIAILNTNNEESLKIAEDIPSQKIYYGSNNLDKCYFDERAVYYDGEEVVELKDILLKGKHNYENICGAIAAVKVFGISNAAIRKVLAEFKGVEHRLEFVAEHHGVKYYNDSKATNCVSTNIALQSFNEPTILLLGGTDRGHSFYDLKDSMGHVKAIVAYGETKNRIADFAKDLGVRCEVYDTLTEAMHAVKNLQASGDIVLLSPACASWDQYAKFEDRGDEFKKLVAEINQ